MNKRRIIAVPIIVLLVISIAVTFVLMNKKPNTSHINNAQKLATYSKPAVVRVFNYAIVNWKFSNYYDDEVVDFFNKIQNQTLIGGSGSGALISGNGYIVTNAHVVELSKLDNQKIADQAFNVLVKQVAKLFDSSESVVREYLLRYVTYEKIDKYLKVIMPNTTEALDGEVKSFGAPVGEGKDVAVLKIEGKNYPTLQIGDSSKVQLQDSIWVFGYPGAADSEILNPNSMTVVSITDGKVSATDKKSAQGAPVLQISAAATHGNSGGPVVDESGKIVGLLTFRGDTVNGQEVQGFNFAVPSETVMEFVNQSGAKNDLSDVDKLYKDGLELYWGGFYKDALVKFEQLQRLNPNHSEIKKLIMDSEQKSSESKILWSKYKTAFIIYDSAAGVIIIVLIVFAFVIKGKKNKEEVIVTHNEHQSTTAPDKNEEKS
jgi:S1-C subfamily serine protease